MGSKIAMGHGHLYTAADCFSNALKKCPTLEVAWLHLGVITSHFCCCLTPSLSGDQRPSLLPLPVCDLYCRSVLIVYASGFQGGGNVCGQNYSTADCMCRVLELKNVLEPGTCDNPHCTKDHSNEPGLLLPVRATAWFCLPRCGGGLVAGCHFSSDRCLEESRKGCENRDWYNSGNSGGQTVAEQWYNAEDCYVRAIEVTDALQPCEHDDMHYGAAAWCNLGCHEHGGVVAGQHYSGRECYIQALELHPDPNTAANSWCNLGQHGGGVVDGIDYDETQCHVKALEMQSQDSKARYNAWYQLARRAGGTVLGRYYNPEQCYHKGCSLDPQYSC